MGKRRAKPDARERFGTAVKFRREELGMTQKELAEAAGIHRTYLSDVERDTRNLALVNIEKLAAALSLSIAKLFEAVEAQQRDAQRVVVTTGIMHGRLTNRSAIAIRAIAKSVSLSRRFGKSSTRSDSTCPASPQQTS